MAIEKTANSDEKILLVDDEEPLRKILGKRLERRGYQVFEAANGKEGMQILTNEQVSLVVSDIRMPEADGVDLLKWIQNQPSRPPVILISGYTDITHSEAKSKGAEAIFSKPLESDEFFKKVDDLISFHRFLKRNG